MFVKYKYTIEIYYTKSIIYMCIYIYIASNYYKPHVSTKVMFIVTI